MSLSSKISRKISAVSADLQVAKAVIHFWALAAALAGLGAVAFGQAASSARAAGFRSITVQTEPGAAVWIDGVRYGITSDAGVLKISTVPAGRKSIRVRADGFKEAVRLLLPAQSGKIAVPLTKTSDPAELEFQRAERLSTVDREKAAAAYEKAASLRTGYIEAYVGLARLYSETNDFRRAEAAIAAARKIKPAVAEISAIEGRLLRTAGDEEKAIMAFKRAIREGKGFQPEAFTGLGLIYKDRAESFGASGDEVSETRAYDEAARNLAIAIRQLSGGEDAAVLYQFLGLIYEQQKKPIEAIRVYKEFLSFFPGHPESSAIESFITQLKKQYELP